MQQYVILRQRAITGWVFSKPNWQAQPLAGPEAIIVLDSIQNSIPLAELYQGLELQSDRDQPVGEDS